MAYDHSKSCPSCNRVRGHTPYCPLQYTEEGKGDKGHQPMEFKDFIDKYLPLEGGTKHAERKGQPVATGVLDYFPDALKAISEASLAATAQHHPDKPMHWDKTKSLDHADCLVRHLMDRGTIDDDGVSHTAKMAWRALALLQTEIEESR